MKRRTRQQRQREAGRLRKRKAQMVPGGNSNYARKKAWLHAHAMWGFDVPAPKPWKSAKAKAA